MLNPFQAIALGIIQGLTEFIPVSSSGHLAVVPELLGWQQPGIIFIAAVHFGTLLALLVYFRHKLWNYMLSLGKFAARKKVSSKDHDNLRLIGMVLLSTIPAGIIGFVLEDTLSNFYSNAEGTTSIYLTLSAMALLGVIFILSPRLFTAKKHSLDKLGWKGASFIGLSQALALIRGTSRSGITLLSAQAVKLDKVSAAEFSFLMSIPVIGATSVYGAYKLLALPSEQLNAELNIAIVGFLAAAISGYFAVRFMLDYLKTKNLQVFGWYRIIFAIVSLILILGLV